MSAAAPPRAAARPAAALRELAAALGRAQLSTGARERRDVLVLLGALALAIAPHFAHLSAWTIGALLALWAWRAALTVWQRPLPGRRVLLPLLVALALLVFWQHGTLIGRDAGVTFLLLLTALKLLEMRARRDVFVVIFLAFFVLLTLFMFSQAPLVALLALVALALLLAVLVSVHCASVDLPASAKLRLVARALLYALPLAALMFLLFPRLSEPLWSMGLDQGSGGRTGLSDRMTPGSVGRLFLDDTPAFRVAFAGALPARGQMYWRGPVLGQFNGRTWSPLTLRLLAEPTPLIQAESRSAIDYTVTLEPTGSRWLYALELPQLGADLAAIGAAYSADAELLARATVSQRQRYAVRSYLDFTLDANLSPLARQDWLQLPPGFNPRTLQLAVDLRRRITPVGTEGRAADRLLLQAAIDHFRTNPFRYSLEPPPLGRHAVDEFLFDFQNGYCEHYASAFVVLMRALDVPARVVTGYLGGDSNPVDGVFTVRQADAHAWAEVWLAERGWVRVDPTATVDPARVAAGARAARRVTDPAAADAPIGAVTWALRVRYRLEALQHGWNQWVLNYSWERQQELLRALRLNPDLTTLGVLFAVALSLALAAVGALSLRQRVARDPLAEIDALLRARLARVGAHAPAHLGPRALAEALRGQLTPASHAAACDLLAKLERWRYSADSPHADRPAIRALRAAVRAYAPQPASPPA